MKKNCLIVFCFLNSLFVEAKINHYTRPQNTFYLQTLGGVSFFSLVYDRTFLNNILSFSAGFGYMGATKDNEVGLVGEHKLFSMPIKINFLGLHTEAHGFEIGGGTTLLYSPQGVSVDASSALNGDQRYGGGNFSPAGLITAAYRYQGTPLNIRLGMDVHIANEKAQAKPFVSFGFSF